MAVTTQGGVLVNNIVLLFVFGLVLVIYMLPAWAAIYIEEKDFRK